MSIAYKLPVTVDQAPNTPPNALESAALLALGRSGMQGFFWPDQALKASGDPVSYVDRNNPAITYNSVSGEQPAPMIGMLPAFDWSDAAVRPVRVTRSARNLDGTVSVAPEVIEGGAALGDNPPFWMFIVAKIGSPNVTQVLAMAGDLDNYGDGLIYDKTADLFAVRVANQTIGSFPEPDPQGFQVYDLIFNPDILSDPQDPDSAVLRVRRNGLFQTQTRMSDKKFEGGELRIGGRGALYNADLFRGHMGAVIYGNGKMTTQDAGAVRAWLQSVYGI